VKKHFPKSARLLKRREFWRRSGKFKRYVGRWLIIDTLPNDKKQTRLGITVTKRFGKAVARNRIKRLIREAFRHIQDQLPSNLDIIVKPQLLAHEAKMQEIQEEMLNLENAVENDL